MSALREKPGHEKDQTRTREGMDHHFDALEHMHSGTLILNRYEVREMLGRGGFGMVFAAYDRVLNSEVAIKFLHPGLSHSSRDFRRVRREINISRRITDPRLVKIFSLESWRGLYFLVMERVRGPRLSDYFAESGEIPWEEFKPVFLNILAGVETLHRSGIVHRDLKPANIIMGKDGIKILDFGMAKAVDDTEQTADIGEIVGSPRYMSPEQVRGEKVGPASDIYQLGLILYMALSGEHPFSESTNTMEMLVNHLEAEPPPLDTSAERLPRFLQEVVARALEKNPRHRFADVSELAEALRRRRVRNRRWRYWIRQRWIRAVMLGLMAVAVFLWALHPLRLTGVDFDDREVKGTNVMGMPLWRRDFSPSSIYRAAPFPLQNSDHKFWKAAPRGRTGVQAIVIPPQNKSFPPEWSLGTLAADSRLVLMDGRGRELFNECFTKAFQLDAHGYSRRFYAYRYSDEDLNGDDVPEQTLLIRHSQSMFPSSLVVLHGGGYSAFISPGVIDRYRVLSRDRDGADLQVVAMANPLAHMRYLARVRIILRGDGQYLHAFPSLTELRNPGTGGQQVILPSGARVKRAGPGDALLFQDTDSEDYLEWRNGSLRVERSSGEAREYADRQEHLTLALQAVQRSYIARLNRHDVAAARRELRTAFRLPLKNPYMRSALFYLRGDLKVEAGEYEGAAEDLEAALDAHPYNMDAACRLCESAFLRNLFEEAERLVTRRFGDHFMFWGLTNGRRLFLLWMDLHRGRFHEARERVDALMFDKPELGKAYGGLVDLFEGRYDRSAAAFTALSAMPPNLFTLGESRLFHARSLVMADRDPERANFLLRDLKIHSHRQGWRAATLLALLDARRGDRSQDLKRRTRQSWTTLRQRVRGDFQARLWLFLDAWCYGRAMEIQGDREAAREGYTACIAANSHSGAAADARERLDRLAE